MQKSHLKFLVAILVLYINPLYVLSQSIQFSNNEIKIDINFCKTDFDSILITGELTNASGDTLVMGTEPVDVMVGSDYLIVNFGADMSKTLGLVEVYNMMSGEKIIFRKRISFVKSPSIDINANYLTKGKFFVSDNENIFFQPYLINCSWLEYYIENYDIGNLVKDCND